MSKLDASNDKPGRELERARYRVGLTNALTGTGTGPVLVHSDVGRVMSAIVPTSERAMLLERHLELLTDVVEGRGLWFPTFNYGYTRTRHFDVASDPSEVGVLSEYARIEFAAWRTPVPVFSLAGNGPEPYLPLPETLDPFGTESAFSRLVELDGAILFHGAGLHSCTAIHHAERMADGPDYRYDKLFIGEVVDAVGTRREHVLRYHVRPMGFSLDYDWSRLRAELLEAAVAQEVAVRGSSALVLGARALIAFWVERLRADPLHLLNADSRTWVRRRLDALGRPFRLEDFEGVGDARDRG